MQAGLGFCWLHITVACVFMRPVCKSTCGLMVHNYSVFIVTGYGDVLSTTKYIPISGHCYM